MDEYYKFMFTCILAMLILIAVSVLSNMVFPNEKLVGHTYKFDVVGYRWDIGSHYRNIMSAEDITNTST